MRYEALALDSSAVVRRQRLRAACFTETSANASAVNSSVSSSCAPSASVSVSDDTSGAVCSTTIRAEAPAGLDPEGRDEILSEVKNYHKKTGTTVLLVSHSMEDIAKYADRVLVMSNKKIAMYDTVEQVFARAPELLALGLSVPQVTKIFLKLREMGVDVPADVYTVPYAVKMILEAKQRRDAGESLVLPREQSRKGGVSEC